MVVPLTVGDVVRQNDVGAQRECWHKCNGCEMYTVTRWTAYIQLSKVYSVEILLTINQLKITHVDIVHTMTQIETLK